MPTLDDLKNHVANLASVQQLTGEEKEFQKKLGRDKNKALDFLCEKIQAENVKLSENLTTGSLKRIFLKNHPDRGGDANAFNKIEPSIKTLIQIARSFDERQQSTQALDASSEDSRPNSPSQNTSHPLVHEQTIHYLSELAASLNQLQQEVLDDKPITEDENNLLLKFIDLQDALSGKNGNEVTLSDVIIDCADQLITHNINPTESLIDGWKQLSKDQKTDNFRTKIKFFQALKTHMENQKLCRSLVAQVNPLLEKPRTEYNPEQKRVIKLYEEILTSFCEKHQSQELPSPERVIAPHIEMIKGAGIDLKSDLLSQWKELAEEDKTPELKTALRFVHEAKKTLAASETHCANLKSQYQNFQSQQHDAKQDNTSSDRDGANRRM